MSYFIWIPLAIIFNVTQAWLSTKVGSHKIFFYLVWIWGSLPMWAFVSKYSSNMFIDSIIYYSIIIVSYSLTILYLTNASVKPINIIGLCLLLLSIFLIKI